MKRRKSESMKNRNLDDECINRKARALGIKKVYGYFYPTEENGLVKDFYKMFSYHLVSEDEQGNSIYILDVDSYEKKETQISIT